jgi:hypothetical protein
MRADIGDPEQLALAHGRQAPCPPDPTMRHWFSQLRGLGGERHNRPPIAR